jgi:ribonuclease HI
MKRKLRYTAKRSAFIRVSGKAQLFRPTGLHGKLFVRSAMGRQRTAVLGCYQPRADFDGRDLLKRLVLTLFVCASANAQLPPLPEATQSGIEYKSVAEALKALRAKPNVEISVQGDWTIVDEPANFALWSFAPKRHAAYPAVVKRKVVEKDGIVSIKTDVICEATKAACDALVREFMQMNQNLKPSLPN